MANSDIGRMPRFSADASLYRSSNKYQVSAIFSPNIGVFPQGCDPIKSIGCAAAVITCAADCASGVGTATCLSCFAFVGADCYECVAGSGSSGGGGGGTRIGDRRHFLLL